MITTSEAKRLHAYIGRAIKAACDAEHAGSQPPEEAAGLRKRKTATRRSLSALITSLAEDAPKNGAA